MSPLAGGSLIFRGGFETGATYHDLGADYYEERGREAISKHLIKRLKKLDYDVELTDRRSVA